MASLRYLDDSGIVHVKTLDAREFLIGRAETCQLAFDSEMISREHVRIEMDGDGHFRIRDLGSRNKTYVNGELIRETLLAPGSVIRVGDRVVEFLDDASARDRVDLSCLTPDRTDPPDCDWVKIKAPISLTTAQVERLSHIVGEQALTARGEDIADAALGRILLDLQAERGLIAMRGQGKTELIPLAHRALNRIAGRSMTPVSQTFVLAPLLQRVAGRYPQTAGAIDLELGYAATALTAPLVCRGEVIGVLYVDRPKAKKPFASSDVPFCSAAGALIGARIGEASADLARFAAREGATWLATVRRLQATLADPVVSSDAFGAAVSCQPGRLRCGDFATLIPIDAQRCAILMIDAGGHGLTGLLQARSIVRAVQVALDVADDVLTDPTTLFNTINRLTAQCPARQVLTCCFLGIDMSAGKLFYINAGAMPPLLMVAPGRLVTLDKMSMIPGVEAESAYQATRVELPESFRLVCHTDGLTEATSAGGEAFSDQRLHELLLEREAFTDAPALVVRINQAWTKHMAGAQAADDATVLVLARG
ncbi:MAG: SpoIIE family protein phosphatase [Phycisphaerae bacterium]